MRPLENILDLYQFTLMSEGKKDPHSSCAWWDDCIYQVKLQVLTDRTTSRDNLREKAKSYASNYFAYQPEASYLKIDTLIDEIADEVEKAFQDVSFDQRPPASVIAQKDRQKIPEDPEKRFIRLR